MLPSRQATHTGRIHEVLDEGKKDFLMTDQQAQVAHKRRQKRVHIALSVRETQDDYKMA